MASQQSNWSRRFDEPIALPNRRKLVTLRDAGEYIAALSAKMQKAAHWETAAQAIILVVEADGHAMLARIAMEKALNHRGKAAAPAEPRRKWAKKYRVVK